MLGLAKRPSYDCVVVRLTGPEWMEYDAQIDNDMFRCFDQRGKQIELWPKAGAVAFHSREGLVYLMAADLPAVTKAGDLGTLEERVPFYALNKPTQDKATSYSTMLAVVTFLAILLMMVWVHGASSDAAKAAATVELLHQTLVKK